MLEPFLPRSLRSMHCESKYYEPNSSMDRRFAARPVREHRVPNATGEREVENGRRLASPSTRLVWAWVFSFLSVFRLCPFPFSDVLLQPSYETTSYLAAIDAMHHNVLTELDGCLGCICRELIVSRATGFSCATVFSLCDFVPEYACKIDGRRSKNGD